MANGSFYKYLRGSSESNYFGLYCEYTYDQNVSENYTNVTVDVWVRYYSLSVSSIPGTITVNGTSRSFTGPAISNYPSGGGGKTKLGSQTIRVNHNADGTKTGVTIKVDWDAQITYSGTTYKDDDFVVSVTVDLPVIPRASTITSAGNITLGNPCQITWTPASANFKYKINFTLGSWSYTTGYILPSTTSVYTYTGYTISGTTVANGTTVYAQMNSANSASMTATLTTYDANGSQIGSSNQKSFSVTVPSNVEPSAGTITLTPVNITTTDGTSQNILVQGKNQIVMSVYGATASTGSSIKSYTYNVWFGSTIIATVGPTTSTSVSLGPFNNAGSLKFVVTVTDTRERSVNIEKTYTCVAYEAPTISSFNAYRAKQNGTADINGTYLKCDYVTTHSSVDGTNQKVVTVHYTTNSDAKTSTSQLINLREKDKTYDVYVTISDSYGGYSATSTITVFGQSRILNITSDGTGVAIGKMAEVPTGYEGIFESRWPAKFDSGVEVDGNLTCGNNCTITSSDTVLTDKNIASYLKSVQSDEIWEGVYYNESTNEEPSGIIEFDQGDYIAYIIVVEDQETYVKMTTYVPCALLSRYVQIYTISNIVDEYYLQIQNVSGTICVSGYSSNSEFAIIMVYGIK